MKWVAFSKLVAKKVQKLQESNLNSALLSANQTDFNNFFKLQSPNILLITSRQHRFRYDLDAKVVVDSVDLAQFGSHTQNPNIYNYAQFRDLEIYFPRSKSPMVFLAGEMKMTLSKPFDGMTTYAQNANTSKSVFQYDTKLYYRSTGKDLVKVDLLKLRQNIQKDSFDDIGKIVKSEIKDFCGNPLTGEVFVLKTALLR